MPMRNLIANDHLILAELCFWGEFVTVQKGLFTKRWGGVFVSIRADLRGHLVIVERGF